MLCAGTDSIFGRERDGGGDGRHRRSAPASRGRAGLNQGRVYTGEIPQQLFPTCSSTNFAEPQGIHSAFKCPPLDKRLFQALSLQTVMVAHLSRAEYSKGIPTLIQQSIKASGTPPGTSLGPEHMLKRFGERNGERGEPLPSEIIPPAKSREPFSRAWLSGAYPGGEPSRLGRKMDEKFKRLFTASRFSWPLQSRDCAGTTRCARGGTVCAGRCDLPGVPAPPRPPSSGWDVFSWSFPWKDPLRVASAGLWMHPCPHHGLRRALLGPRACW